MGHCRSPSFSCCRICCRRSFNYFCHTARQPQPRFAPFSFVSQIVVGLSSILLRHLTGHGSKRRPSADRYPLAGVQPISKRLRISPSPGTCIVLNGPVAKIVFESIPAPPCLLMFLP
jgi:hypothetical protein